jgi:hypothetical protein
MAMITAGNTAHFGVAYDSALSSAGLAMAQAVLTACEEDFATLSYLFAVSPPAGNLPFQINIVSGSGGGYNDLVRVINCTVPATFIPANLPALVVAEEAEIFMTAQQRGWIPTWSDGEALSRVCAQILYPTLRFLWSTGTSWLNGDPSSTTAARSDWIDSVKHTDQDNVATGCGSLFLNYLAYQIDIPWTHIIRGGALPTNTLKDTAVSLGLSPATAFSDFLTLLNTHYPPTQHANIPDDDPFPLGQPSLYLRHNLADDGTYQVGPLANSPDIIVRNTAVASPQATFSTAASRASDTESDPNVLDTQDNYVYLRVWNRGMDAPNVTATVYWSPPATLVTPSMWNLVGSAAFADVPPGNVVKVSTPGITWPQASIPTAGHYCFVATVGSTSEPAPNPADFGSFQDFVDYIYSHNNITWRNFNVVSISQQNHPVPHIRLPFLITGAPKGSHTFTFETQATLPNGSELALDVPKDIGRGLRAPKAEVVHYHDSATNLREPGRVRLTLQPGKRQTLGEITLPGGLESASQLLVYLPEEHRERAHEVFVRQLYEGREVGRITWRLVP